MPLFSILIPTRNRADLLRYAIQSVLQQDCDDYELVVSDNDSSDDTRRTVLQFNSPKIRYINTGKHLMVHDSYNFAFAQATGDYILLLGDDDYLVPGVLRLVKKVIQETSAPMVSWGYITYNDATYSDEGSQNTIQTRKFTNSILKVNTRDVLKAYFGFRNTDPRQPYPPFPSAVFISRHIADEISNKYGVFYASPLADITAIPRSSAYTDFLFIIDKPLVVLGRGSRSGVHRFVYSLNDAWNEIASELSFVLFKGKYLINLYTEALLKVKHGDPERFKDYDINMEQYCIMYYQWMIGASGAGYDISADLKEFHEKLSTLPPGIQTKVREYIRRREYRMQDGWLLKFARRSPLYNIAAARILMNRLYARYLKIRYGGSLSKSRYENNIGTWDIVSGNKVGVHDIASCASHIVEIARALKQPVDAWDYQKEPIW
ncbi:MAG: glycosyltransferase family 2 protein [Chloroflexi bacterium]|nr:glycosyltransferase family 2 protein [Chloroflexota bacterium]